MVVADAFADQRFAAHVRSISPVVDAQRGAVEIKLALEQEGKRSAHLVIAQATLVSQAVRNSKKR